jgi:hypothetical protein
MSTGTARYRFEFRLLDWAEGYVRTLAGSRRSFFVGFRKDGTLRRLYVSLPGHEFDGEGKRLLTEAYTSWFLFQPHEEAGAGYLEWLDLPKEVPERWLGDRFGAEDYLDVRHAESREHWPRSWRVVVR